MSLSKAFRDRMCAKLEIAIEAVIDALATGAPVVEYEIRNRRVKREPTAALLDDLMKQLNRMQPNDSLRVAKMSRTSRV